jgi:iron complex outermembrane receptor protein
MDDDKATNLHVPPGRCRRGRDNRDMTKQNVSRAWLAPVLLGAVGAACGQSTERQATERQAAETRPAAAPAASAPARPASAPAPQPAPPAQGQQRIEITGGRNTDTEERRRSTAAKIVIGREEIDKFGDATLGEVLRRLPGVVTPGAPGRGGPPRLRGLGNGYTQLLIDGQRIPPGFSLESLTPEQIERIEILRAPTAETGARAIAGTINIVTREGFKRRLNDLRLGFGYENGKFSPGISWTHNDSVGDFIYNVSASVFKPERLSSNDTRTTVTNVDTGTLLEDRSGHTDTTEHRVGLNVTTRLQWRLREGGDVLVLTPSLFHTEARTDNAFTLVQPLRRATTPVFYDFGSSSADSRFSNLRLGAQWRQHVGPVRLEINANGGGYRSLSNSLRYEYAQGTAQPVRVLEDHTDAREISYNLALKGTGLAGGNEQGGEHGLVGGAELEGVHRNDTRTSYQTLGALTRAPLLADFGDEVQASSLRTAAFIQDEWNITPSWATQAGLRWEGITTQGDSGDGLHPSNRSAVLAPLLHAVWKPDPKGRDQVRLSLTRSYRSPPLAALISRPSISRDYPVGGPNIVTSPDSAGNPELKPELATGLDLAVERYLEAGGVLSANVFYRRINNLIRGVTTLETVDWSPVPRFVRRQQNIGDANTSGLELEAKFRLDQLISAAAPVELRSNLSFFRSRVQNVPGPDNRLDQQAKSTANLGADYRLRGLPLTLGGNYNWVPGYRTQVEAGQAVTVSKKEIWDAYALWTFNPATALRLLGSNLRPRDYASTQRDEAPGPSGTERTTVRSNGPSYINWQLRLELKL